MSRVRPAAGSSIRRASFAGDRQPAGLAEPELDRRRERDPRLPRGRRERRSADSRRLDAERQLDLGRAALERGELLHHRARGRGAIEDAPCLRRPNDDLDAVTDDARRRAARGSRPCAIRPSWYCERAVQDARRRRHVGSEELHVEALEAADRAEAVTLALRRADRRLPVGLDPELGRPDRVTLATREEDDRLVLDRVGAPLEQRRGRPSRSSRRRRCRRSSRRSRGSSASRRRRTRGRRRPRRSRAAERAGAGARPCRVAAA